MQPYIKNTSYQGEPCVEFSAGGYLALFAPKIGGLLLRLKDIKNNLELLRFSDENKIEDIREVPLIYGLPTLYLPNRLYKGVLKTSEKTYQLPINEADLNNFIHGFIHKREYTVVKMEADENSAIVSAEYIYDENDEFYSTLPIKFKAVLTYTLSEKGLEHQYTITNLSQTIVPVSVACHTAINCVFSENSNPDDLRMSMNVLKRLELDKSSNCTGEIFDLNEHDLAYKNAEMNPKTTVIDNEMYLVSDKDSDGNDFYGVKFFDVKTGQTICYEAGQEYKYWLVWNEWAKKGYCCPEPMSGMINCPNIPLDADVTGYLELKNGESWTGYQRLYSFIK